MKPNCNLTHTVMPPARRSLLTLCLACSLVSGLLAACGGSSSGNESAMAPIAGATATPAIQASLSVPASGGVVDYFKQKLIASRATGEASLSVTAASVTSTTDAASTVAFAGTTLQERGVDENDWVKTDGSLLYGLSKAYTSGNGAPTAALLQAQRRLASGQLQAVGSLSLPDELIYSGMYLVSSANRLALVGQKFDASTFRPILPLVSPTSLASNTLTTLTGSASSAVPGSTTAAVSDTIVLTPQVTRTGIDLVATPPPGAVTAALSVASRIRIDGNLVGSRVIGSTLYVVTSWQPDLRKYAFPVNATPAQAQAAVASLSAADILPTVTIDGGAAQTLVTEADCYVQTANASMDRQVTTITAFNLASPTLQRNSRCFLGGTQALYMSSATVYLASSRYFNYGPNVALTTAPAGSTTDIHKFALAGQNIDYRGSGEVAGHLGWDADKNAYRMSEYQGDLRVLTFTGQQGWSAGRNGSTSAAPAPSPATLTVLRETPASGTPRALQVVATLPNAQRPAALGKPGEQVYAVQFVGARAYVVTFRRTDPLYVLDLSNPADPKTSGELELPGYSDYLYPLGDTLLLGVGKDADTAGVVQGIKVTLMDVADPTRPSVRSTAVLGKRGSVSGLDFSSRGINVLQQGNLWRIALPVRLHEAPAGTSSFSFFDPTTQGLARFEVDARAKTMVSKPLVTGLTFPVTNPYSLAYGQYELSQERSVQIDSLVYYFSGGSFLVSSW